ncbi:hypothetical protein DIPPA_30773 [Diplonema papillatum]|nr:hypothetical protein DIPPA_30773 [Diplonema papillatum]
MKACLFACAVVSGALGDVVVDPSKKFQTIEGFGAANIMPWQPDVTAADIQTAFGAAPYGQTAGLNILRVRLPPDEAEFGLNLPTTRALAAYYSHVKIIATPWSPLYCFSPPRLLRNTHREAHFASIRATFSRHPLKDGCVCAR